MDDAGMGTQTQTPTTSVTVAEAMSTSLIHCSPETPLRVVARLMATHRIHGVYVFDYSAEDDESTSLWGLVTDLDLVAALPVIDERTAGNSAVTPLVTIASDDAIEQAAQMMAENASTHLAVIDPETGRPVGVLSTMDIARVIASSEDISERS
jgi:CBS domain-containing protein